jgi:leucyl aminopeptidase
MTDFASLIALDRGQQARPIHLIDKKSFEAWLKSRPAEDRALIEAQRFDAKAEHAFVVLPRGNEFEVVNAVKDDRDLSPWCLAALAERLPEGTYKLADGNPGKAALGWLLSQHRFDAYRSKPEEPSRGPRVLIIDQSAIEPVVKLAEATALVRDLVNTPAADMGPAELEKAAKAIGTELGAAVRVTAGKELTEGFP